MPPFVLRKLVFALRKRVFAVRKDLFALLMQPFAVRKHLFALRIRPFALQKHVFAARKVIHSANFYSQFKVKNRFQAIKNQAYHYYTLKQWEAMLSYCNRLVLYSFVRNCVKKYRKCQVKLKKYG